MQVTKNTIVNVIASNSADVFGIAIGSYLHQRRRHSPLQDVANATITGNFIGTVLKTDTFSAAGISLATTNYGTSRIANNSVYGVLANSTPGDFTAGIFVGSAGTTYATTQIYFNSVSMTGARDAPAWRRPGATRSRSSAPTRSPTSATTLSTTRRPLRTAAPPTRRAATRSA